MSDQAKEIIWSLWADQIEQSVPFTERRPDLFHTDVVFHGPAPIGRLNGYDALREHLYGPLAESFSTIRRMPYLFFADRYEDTTWVGTTGDWVGRMVRPFLGIMPGPAPRRLRFGEFYKVEDGAIREIRCLFDIPGLAAQAGIHLLPPFAGHPGPVPGPQSGNGINREPQSGLESAITRDLVTRLIGGCNVLDGSDLKSMGMETYWHDDMVWHGPWGIGSAYGFDEFQRFAQGPSVSSFPNRRGTWPKDVFIAEGCVSGFAGWPSLVGEFTGAPFRGIPATGSAISQTIMDFYIRRGDKLWENWVLIDLVDFAHQCGVDLLAPLDGAAQVE
ncbi:MAG: ester cyclase [Alphaproteobacteria bacterium]|nr:ester cyclase [Alphaproteobacteria bacterium]